MILTARMVAGILLALVGFASSGAEESSAYRQGKEAADRGEYQQAHDIFLPAARRGDPWAQFGLGVLSLQGQGMAKNAASSSRWFQLAAEQGHPFAQFNLGNAYLHGRGLKPDMGKAAFWWQRAAEQGNAKAQNNLGTLLYTDYSTTKSRRLGIAWLRAAAHRGDESARNRLAEIRINAPYSEDPDWEEEPERSEVAILIQDPAHYTIQLFVGRQKESVRRFLAREGLTGKVFIYRLSHGKGYWYGVLFGSYGQAATAAQTLTRMRPSLKQLGPWVRRFRPVQKSIRAIHSVQLVTSGQSRTDDSSP